MGMLEMRISPILGDFNMCMPLKERRMVRRMVIVVLVISLRSLSPGPLAVANDSAVGRYSVYPRVVATVLTLAPREMATIQRSRAATAPAMRWSAAPAGRSGTRSPVSTALPGGPPGELSSAGRPRNLGGRMPDAVRPRSAAEPRSGVTDGSVRGLSMNGADMRCSTYLFIYLLY